MNEHELALFSKKMTRPSRLFRSGIAALCALGAALFFGLLYLTELPKDLDNRFYDRLVMSTSPSKIDDVVILTPDFSQQYKGDRLVPARMPLAAEMLEKAQSVPTKGIVWALSPFTPAYAKNATIMQALQRNGNLVIYADNGLIQAGKFAEAKQVSPLLTHPPRAATGNSIWRASDVVRQLVLEKTIDGQLWNDITLELVRGAQPVAPLPEYVGEEPPYPRPIRYNSVYFPRLSGPPDTVPVIYYDEMMAADFDMNRVKGRFVMLAMVGTGSNITQQFLVPTPGSTVLFSGTQYMAQVIHSLASDVPHLREIGAWRLAVSLTLIIGLLIAMTYRRLASTMWYATITVLLLATVISVTLYYFAALIVPLGTVFFVVLCGVIAQHAFRLFMQFRRYRLLIAALTRDLVQANSFAQAIPEPQPPAMLRSKTMLDQLGELAMAQAQARQVIETIIDRSPVGIALVGADGQVRRSNAVFNSLFTHPDSFVTFAQQMELQDGHTVIRKVGDRDLALQLSQINGNNIAAGAVVSVNDVTAINELQRTRERWTAFVTHDLRAPLSRILHLASQIKDPPSSAASIATQAQSALTLADDFSSLNLLGGEYCELLNEVEWRLLVENCVKSTMRSVSQTNQIDHTPRITLTWHATTQTAASKPIDSNLEQAVDTYEIWLVPRAIIRMLSNLLINAIQHGHPTLPITVESGVVNNAVVTTIRNTKCVDIDVIDSMSMSFDQASTTNIGVGGIGGVGIGLEFCRRVLEAHNSALLIQDTYDIFEARFSLHLAETQDK